MYCRCRPSQATPDRRLLDLQSNLRLGEELELLGLAPSCSLCQGSTNLEKHKELQAHLQSCIDSRTILTRIGTPPDLGHCNALHREELVVFQTHFYTLF